MKKKILILEDDPNRTHIFHESLGDLHDVTITETAKGAIHFLENEEFDIIFLDHDLGGQVYVDTDDPNTGSEVVRWLNNNTISEQPKIVIHTMNLLAGNKMFVSLSDCGFDDLYFIPFSHLREILDDPTFLS